MRRDVAWASSPHAPLPGTKESQNQRRKEGRGEGDRERERQKGRKQAKGTMMRCVTQSGYAMCEKLFLSSYTKGDVKPLHVVFSTIEVLTPTCRILLCSRSQVSLPWFCDSWAPRRAAKRIFCMRFHLAPAGHRSGEVHVGCWDLALLVFHTTLLALDGETANEKLLVFVATGLSI